MWPLILLGAVAYLLGKSASSKAMPVPPPGVGPLPPGVGPLPPGPEIPLFAPTMLLHPGVLYDFSALSNLSEEAFVAQLADVGADVTAFTSTSLAGSSTIDGYAGTFVWNGPDGEPVNDIPGVTWLLVTLAPSETSVSGLSGLSWGAIGHDGLDLSGMSKQVEAWGQAPWQNIAHGNGPPEAQGGTLSKSQPYPMQFDPRQLESLRMRGIVDASRNQSLLSPHIAAANQPAYELMSPSMQRAQMMRAHLGEPRRG